MTYIYRERPEWRWRSGYRSTGKAKVRKPANPNNKCQICKHTREQHIWDTDATPHCGVDGCSCSFFHGPHSCNKRTHPSLLCPQYKQTQPEPDAPTVDDYDRCANPACQHWKRDHCTKHKPGMVNRLKRGELAYKILIKPDGVAYGCKHFSLDDPACQCTSTSCSATENGQDFCGCEKFLNPLLKPKPEKPAKPRKKKALAEPVAVPPAVVATDSASETAVSNEPAKVRKPRVARKKKPAAVTGELFPPPPPSNGQILDLLSENAE